MDNNDIEKILKGYKVEPLSPSETVKFNRRLDSRIDRYQRRAVSMYGQAYGRGSAKIARMSFGLGAAMIALIAISVIAIWSGVGQYNRQINGSLSELDLYYYENSLLDYSYTDADTLDEGYVDLLIDNYADDLEGGSTETLLGDITDEELKYLKENLGVGDIL